MSVGQKEDVTLKRAGLDWLLARYPDAEVALVYDQAYPWPPEHLTRYVEGPWLLVDLVDGIRKRQFAIWKSTGAVYRVTGGAVGDDPLWIPE